MIVVTGAAGYVGGRLVQHLRRDGVPVVALGRRAAPDWLLAIGAAGVEVDLASPAVDLAGLLAGAAAVVHLAGADEVAAAADPAGTTAATVAAAQHVGAAAAAAGVPRVVHLSTVHVYGDRARPGAVLTEDLRCEPRHPYATARLAAEHLLAGAVEPSSSATDLVVLRLTNAVGAPAHPSVDRWSLLVLDLVRQGATTGALVLRTPGLQWRDFCALDEVCAGITAALDPSLVPAGTYNLGSGVPRQVLGVAGLVADAFEARTGSRPPIEAPRADDEGPAPHRVDVGRLHALGVTCGPSIDAAVAEAVASLDRG